MNEDKIRTYDELNIDEKEVLDFFQTNETYLGLHQVQVLQFKS